MKSNPSIPARFRWIPPLAVALSALFLIAPAAVPLASRAESHSPYERFAALPIKQTGRIKVWDSFARETLLSFHGKQSLRTEHRKMSAAEWITKVFFESETANKLPVFRIDHEDLKTALGISDQRQKYFSYDNLFPSLAKIDTLARLSEPQPEARDAFQKAVIQLHGKLVRYQQLLTALDPLFIRASDREAFEAALKTWLYAPLQTGGETPLPWHGKALESTTTTEDGVEPAFLYVSAGQGNWITLPTALSATTAQPNDHFLLQQIQSYLLLKSEWLQPAKTEQAFTTLEAATIQRLPQSETGILKLEYVFNQTQPFILSIELYIVVFLVTLIAWIFVSKTTLRSAFWLLLFTFVLHSAAVLARMWIMGRPPVTNLYSSAVFVGWGTVGLGLFLEWIFRNGIGSAMGSITGLLSLIIAQHLMEMGDTLGLMRAVLDSNFWLTTHVITVTLGYSATFVAGFIAIFYVLFDLFTERLNEALEKTFLRMVWGIICFALLFSFVGTFLGGIWADQSWGRFWGWDPKENGALLIVVWNAVILHAKHAHQIGTKGVMLCAIFGNMVTAWSWFGTNMLGQGLHSYGFMESALLWLFLFWLSQTIFILLGFIPKTNRMSHLFSKPADN